MNYIITNVLPQFLEVPDIWKIPQLSKLHYYDFNKNATHTLKLAIVASPKERREELIISIIGREKIQIFNSIMHLILDDTDLTDWVVRYGNFEMFEIIMAAGRCNLLSAFDIATDDDNTDIVDNIIDDLARTDIPIVRQEGFFARKLPLFANFVGEIMPKYIDYLAKKAVTKDRIDLLSRLNPRLYNVTKVITLAAQKRQIHMLNNILTKVSLVQDDLNKDCSTAVALTKNLPVFKLFMEKWAGATRNDKFQAMIIFGDIDMIKECTYNFKCSQYNKFMNVACRYKNFEIINYLISKGGQLTSGIHGAVASGDVEFVKEMISKGAKLSADCASMVGLSGNIEMVDYVREFISEDVMIVRGCLSSSTPEFVAELLGRGLKLDMVGIGLSIYRDNQDIWDIIFLEEFAEPVWQYCCWSDNIYALHKAIEKGFKPERIEEHIILAACLKKKAQTFNILKNYGGVCNCKRGNRCLGARN